MSSAEFQAPTQGCLIVNADDWGRDRETTDRTLDCVACGSVSAVSAMVFMEDSERAAEIALERNIDTGLHLNFTLAFGDFVRASSKLREHQERIAKYLRRHRLAQILFHPQLTRSFEHVVSSQLDEFQRLYGVAPSRLDGHHHMHLCANVVWGNLMPTGTAVRRNFSFQAGEKSFWNRFYRGGVDRRLAQRHRLMDYFFSLPPMAPAQRVEKILSLASKFSVELETHPVKQEEYKFLMAGEAFRKAGVTPMPPAAFFSRAGGFRTVSIAHGT
jgi:predicted glycoside hydrolase/deacetylase ChbG (UPF0249 family)